MSFAFPAALWALPAAALPLAIHLLSRRAARRLPFSDLTLLAAIEARSRPRSRLRELLLLAARTLLILALVLAAAGPVARGSAAAAGGEGLDLVLLLDGSYSMRARDAGRVRFEAARDAGLRLLKRLAPGDRAALGVFDEKLRAPLAWASPAAAAEAISRASAGLRGTDAGAALSAARDLLSRSARGRRRAVVVLGDGAAHMLRGAAPAPADGAAVLGLRFPELANGWIAGAEPAVGSSARDPRLSVRVGAAGAAERAALDLWVDGRRSASASAEVLDGGEARVSLALPPPDDARAPQWAGRVAQRPDALPDDDEEFFALRLRPAPRVLVLHAGPSFDRPGAPSWYLRQLFGGGERSLAGREADFLAVGRWAEADLSRYGTVILCDAGRSPPGLSEALERFASAGGGVWVIPDGGASAADLADLSAWLPARFDPPGAAAPGPGLRVVREASETADWNEFALARVSFDRRFGLEPAPQSRTWLADAGGAPLLVAGPVGRGRAVVWAAPLDEEWSNLGLKPVFVSWARACLSLTLPPEEDEARRPFFVGEPLTRTWRADEPAPDRVVVRGPDGRRTELEVRGRKAVLPSADKPGLYEFEEPGGARTTFAVNLDASRGESDLTQLSSPPWTPVSPDDLEQTFFSDVYGRDRRGWCLTFAALMLALEMLLSLPLSPLPSKPAARRSGTPAAAALVLLALLCAGRASAQQSDRFVWAQLQLGASWDPYPDAPARLLAWLAEVTSALVAPERRVLRLGDPALFSSPFLYLAGSEAPPALTEAELRRLRQYLAGGGMLWIEDSTGGPPGTFDAWTRSTLALLLPDSPLKPLPTDDVLYRTFFLLRGPVGRVELGALEGSS
ncbi:MAG TPA: DUF4159 domain-containing protein, partial [Elusimicrobiota bacterium]|nr:DUF4159 domain-containing protein [Elusimicrobiota bacterium]